MVPLMVVLLVVSGMGASLYMYRMNMGDRSGEETLPPGTGWLESYTPKYSFGSEKEDWWVWYPDQHTDPGTTVTHTDWVLDSIGDHPVMIYVHSDNCPACRVQEKDLDSVLPEFRSNLTLYYLKSDDSDDRSTEAFRAYDPTGDQHYIPLTVLITLIQDANGNVRIGWHAREGATGPEWLEDHIKDAIYYHRTNIDAWEP